ncbi:hypothetical protein KC360_g175 [Hortaea werneckii]|nr:hypothetical protein KC344_g179 [Hortaea werneckii]KAI7180576.1 hypothetical protein KC360_g175 [Hortaea werneckii]
METKVSLQLQRLLSCPMPKVQVLMRHLSKPRLIPAVAPMYVEDRSEAEGRELGPGPASGLTTTADPGPKPRNSRFTLLMPVSRS